MDIDAVSQEIRRALFDVIEEQQRINSQDFDETIRKVLASRTIRSAPAGTAGQQAPPYTYNFSFTHNTVRN